MHRQLLSLGLLCLLPTLFGCAMCCSNDDYHYAAHGGRWQRHDLEHGRVGSQFYEAGYDTLAGSQPLAPVEADESERPAPGDDELLPQPGDDGVTAADSSHNRLASFIW